MYNVQSILKALTMLWPAPVLTCHSVNKKVKLSTHAIQHALRWSDDCGRGQWAIPDQRKGENRHSSLRAQFHKASEKVAQGGTHSYTGFSMSVLPRYSKLFSAWPAFSEKSRRSLQAKTPHNRLLPWGGSRIPEAVKVFLAP